jgi:uncharacterized protein involved in exopolysaccharide biosynthesis
MKAIQPSEHSGNGQLLPYRSSSTRDVLTIVFRRRRVIGLSFGGLLAGALLAVCLLPSTYEAELKILMQRKRVDPVITTNPNVIEQDRQLTADEVSSEVELFQSRDSLEKAVVDFELYEPRGRWSLGAVKLRVLGALGLAPDRNARIYQAVLKMEKDLQVIPVNDSDIIKVTYDSRSPRLAAQVLNELGRLYLAKHVALHHPPGTPEFFDQQAEQYKKELKDAQTQLVNFSQQTGVVSADLQKQATLQRLSEFDASLQKTRSEIAGTEQRLRDLKTQEASVPSRVTTQVRTSDNSQLMANLKSTLLNLELKRTELLQKYDPSYPLVQEVEKEISQNRAAIAVAERDREETTDQDPTHEWLKTETAKAKADLVDLKAQAAAISQAVDTLRNEAVKLDRQSVVQQDLLRTAKTNEDNYLLYLRKREEAHIADALDQRRIVNAAIAEVPTVPWVPTGLPAGAKLLLGCAVAAMLSLGLGFVSEYLDPRFGTPAEMQHYLDIPALAAFPALPGNGHSLSGDDRSISENCSLVPGRGDLPTG